MKLAIMQPYFLPYIGYFQLINAVDKFVIYDDVQFINKGWINRNCFLNAGNSAIFTIPLQKGPQTLRIHERLISVEWFKQRDKLMETFRRAYKQAPNFEQTIELLNSLLYIESSSLSEFVRHTVVRICQLLGIETTFMISSNMKLHSELAGQERILSMCSSLGAEIYINPIGGMELYDKSMFQEAGIDLFFLKPNEVEYLQFKNEFIPQLSIIDVLMFNPIEIVREYLGRYELVGKDEKTDGISGEN